MMRAARGIARFVTALRLALRLAGAVGAVGGRLRVFLVTALLGARRILRRPARRLYPLRVRVGADTRTVFVSDYGELEVMRDILVDEDYRAPFDLDPAVIVDVGANIGLAALYFRAHYPRAQIVALEPDPATFVKLRKNLDGDAQIRLLQVAAAAEPGEVELYRPSGYSIASSLKNTRSDVRDAVQVRAETLDGLWDELRLGKVDLLKLDVEGAELDVLRGFSRLSDVRAVLGEAHPRLLGEQTDEFFAHFKEFEVQVLSQGPDAISFAAMTRAHAPAASRS